MQRPFHPSGLALPIAQVSGTTSAASKGLVAMVMRIVTAAPLQHIVVVPIHLPVATCMVVRAAPRIDPDTVNPIVIPAVGDTVAVVL